MGGGHRTYVTKVGLIIGANGGHVFRAGDNVPEGEAQNYFKLRMLTVAHEFASHPTK